MRLRHKKNAEVDILSNPFCIHTVTKDDIVTNDIIFDSKKIFGNDNPLYLELGMGKGQFVIEMSKKYPDINFIGIEKSATIVLKAIDKLMQIDKQNVHDNNNSNNNLSTDKYNSLIANHRNLRFMCNGVENIDQIFKPHSIDKIFLNFSDPWPKKRHESRRLTHHSFLSIYEKLLKPNSLLEFKTDNKDLFDFSLEEIKNSNFELLEFTYDLHNDKKLNEGNVMTEYENKFSKLGNKICKLIAKI